MGASHNTIRELLENEDGELLNAFNSIVNNVYGSRLLSDIIEFLDDDNVFLKHVSNKNKVALVSLMKQYYLACGDLFIVDCKLDKLMGVSKQEIYSIETTSGIRIATKSEVENGVAGLITAKKYLLDAEKYKLMNLLMWTINGRLSYFKQAGFDYKYDKEIGLTDTIYDLIVIAGSALKDMIRWVANKKEFKSDTDILRSALKKGKYKYPDYAVDEVRVDISIKQLLFYLTKNLPRKSNNQRYRDALHMIIKEQSNKYYKLTPGNVAFLREVYMELVSGEGVDERDNTVENQALKEECDNLLKNREVGLIHGSHFAFVIIDSLKKYNYSKCSKKQYAIIREATLKINKDNPEVQDQTGVYEDSPVIFGVGMEIAGASLMDISNALGNGKFESDK